MWFHPGDVPRFSDNCPLDGQSSVWFRNLSQSITHIEDRRHKDLFLEVLVNPFLHAKFFGLTLQLLQVRVLVIVRIERDWVEDRFTVFMSRGGILFIGVRHTVRVFGQKVHVHVLAIQILQSVFLAFQTLEKVVVGGRQEKFEVFVLKDVKVVIQLELGADTGVGVVGF